MKSLLLWIFVMAALVSSASGAEQVPDRRHVVRQGLASQDYGEGVTHNLPALGSTSGIGKQTGQSKSSQQKLSGDFEFVAVDVALDGDYDGDGHYYVLELDWDADTVFAEADVYAVVWLSYEAGPWEEFITTSVYTLFGNSSLDRYKVESELESGYPTGEYDVLLELYDPTSGELLADLGPADTFALSLLPLEDRSRDDVIYDDDYYGGGGLGVVGLAMLLLGLTTRRRLDRCAARL